jgi:hypothetical protein
VQSISSSARASHMQLLASFLASLLALASAQSPYPQCTKPLSAACGEANAQLEANIAYLMVTKKVQVDGYKVAAASANDCDKTLHKCVNDLGKEGYCCEMSYDWSNYTADITLLTDKGNGATGALGGKACFMKDVILKAGGGAVQSTITHQQVKFFPAACANSADISALELQQSCTCKASAPTLEVCNQTYVC